MSQSEPVIEPVVGARTARVVLALLVALWAALAIWTWRHGETLLEAAARETVPRAARVVAGGALPEAVPSGTAVEAEAANDAIDDASSDAGIASVGVDAEVKRASTVAGTTAGSGRERATEANADTEAAGGPVSEVPVETDAADDAATAAPVARDAGTSAPEGGRDGAETVGPAEDTDGADVIRTEGTEEANGTDETNVTEGAGRPSDVADDADGADGADGAGEADDAVDAPTVGDAEGVNDADRIGGTSDESDVRESADGAEPSDTDTEAEAEAEAEDIESLFELRRREEIETLSELLESLRFEPLDDTPAAASREPLERAFEILFLYPDTRLRLVVENRESNDVAFDRRLARERAETVVDYLVSRGIERARLSATAGDGGGLPFGEHRVRVTVEDTDR